MKILCIIPAYNEGRNLGSVIDGLGDYLSEMDYVIINDGSRDDTLSLCKERGYNYIDLPIQLGLSGAIRTGMRYAMINDYDYAIQFDGDGQHNPEYILPMVEYAQENGFDVVIGSRFVDRKRPFGIRTIGSMLISGCIRLTTGKVIKDPTSGMRLYNRRVIEYLARDMNSAPEPDTIAYLIRGNASVGEYQVHMNERQAGESYLDPVKSIKYMINIISSIMVVQWFRKRSSICQ